MISLSKVFILYKKIVIMYKIRIKMNRIFVETK